MANDAATPGPRATVREDWLTRQLERRPGFFVSGSRAMSESMVPGSIITVRLAGHFPAGFERGGERLPPFYALMTVFVCVELPTSGAVRDFGGLGAHGKLGRLFHWLGRHLPATPVALLVFSELHGEGAARSLDLWVLDPDLGIDGRLVSPGEYADRLNAKRNPVPGGDPPTIKAVEASVNDGFQWWTRRYLTRQLSINDLDAIYWAPGRIFFLEFKRSDQREWFPYEDDVPNYLLLRSLQRVVPGSQDVTVRQSKGGPPYGLDLFVVDEINWERVKGRCWRILPGNEASVMVERLLVALASLVPPRWEEFDRPPRKKR